jgi:hypothetical protein
MLVNETSRLSQLTPAGTAKLSALMTQHSLMFSTVTREISDTVKGMDESAYEESIDWYFQAHSFADELAKEFGTSLEIAAGIIAAVSPRMPWLRNKSVAAGILREYRKYLFLSPLESAYAIGLGLSSNVAMAVKIARGEEIAEVLTGTKRRSFYNNIVSPDSGDSVTVDTWMVRAFMNTSNLNLKDASELLRKGRVALGGTGAGYYVIAEAVRGIAENMSLQPHQVQAAYWTAVSGSINGAREDIS